jgi:signal transduction histidine kinase
MLRRFEAFVDRALPLAYAARSPDERRRARFAVVLAWVASLCFIVAAIGHAVAGSYLMLLIDIGLTLLVGSTPLMGRRLSYEGVQRVLNTMIAACFLALMAMAVFVRGGALNAVTVNMVLIPVFATWLIGIRAGAVWTGVTVASTVGLALLARGGLIHDHLLPWQRLLFDHVGQAMLIVVSFAIAAFFEDRRRQSLVEIAALEAERRRIELEQARALGRLAAATAHEINNPLTYISVNLQSLAQTLAVADAAQKPIAEALEGVERIIQSVARLRHCLPPHDEELSDVVVAEAVAQAVAVAEPYTRTRARVEVKVDDVPVFVGDRARLVDVLVGLMLHAAQALPEGPPGQLDRCRIVVSARQEAGQIVAEVRDTHPVTAQLSPETASVSLALCEGLARSIGGRLDVEVAPEETVARVTLPLAS